MRTEQIARIIELKTWPEPFVAVRSGLKPWELRKNDRDYQVGDVLRLREWSPETEDYSGAVEERTVTWMLHGGAFGLPEGYVIMSLAKAAAIEAVLVGDGWKVVPNPMDLAERMAEWAGRDHATGCAGCSCNYETDTMRLMDEARDAILAMLSASPLVYSREGEGASVAKSAAGDASHLTASETQRKSEGGAS